MNGQTLDLQKKTTSVTAQKGKISTSISKTNIQGNQTRFHCDKRHSSNKLNLLEAVFEEEHL